MGLVYYLIAINLLAILVYGLDKRRAIKNKWRVKELYLFLIALLGGAIGSLMAMYAFHHKTKKISFVLGVPILILLNLGIFYLLFLRTYFEG